MPSPTPAFAKPIRLDRARMDRATYPSIMTLPARFDDIDVLGHVNNVSIVAYLQEARIAFTRAMRESANSSPQRAFVAAMQVEYAAEMAYPGMIEIRTGLIDIGRTSYTFAQVVLQEGSPCVYSVIAMVNAGDAGAEPLSDAFRATLEHQGCITEASLSGQA